MDAQIGRAQQRRMTIREIAADSGMIVFTWVLALYYDRVVTISFCGIPFPALFLLSALYFLPILFGRLYTITFASSPAIIRKMVLFTMVTNLLFIFVYLLYLMINHPPGSEKAGISIFIIAIVFLIMGPIAGFMDMPRSSDGISATAIINIFTIGLIPLFLGLLNLGDIVGDINDALELLIILGLMLSDVLLIIILALGAMGLRKVLISSGAAPIADRLYRHSLPFAAEFLLVIFNIMAGNIIMNATGGTGEFRVPLTLLLFVFTGVLPLRLLILISPPVSIYTIASAILSTAVLLYAVLR